MPSAIAVYTNSIGVSSRWGNVAIAGLRAYIHPPAAAVGNAYDVEDSLPAARRSAPTRPSNETDLRRYLHLACLKAHDVAKPQCGKVVLFEAPWAGDDWFARRVSECVVPSAATTDRATSPSLRRGPPFAWNGHGGGNSFADSGVVPRCRTPSAE